MPPVPRALQQRRFENRPYQAHITFGDSGAAGGTTGAPGAFAGPGAAGGATGGAASGAGAGVSGARPSAGPVGVPSPGGVEAGGIGAIPPGDPAGGPAGPGPAVLNKNGSISENQAGILVTDFQGPLGLLPR